MGEGVQREQQDVKIGGSRSGISDGDVRVGEVQTQQDMIQLAQCMVSMATAVQTTLQQQMAQQNTQQQGEGTQSTRVHRGLVCVVQQLSALQQLQRAQCDEKTQQAQCEENAQRELQAQQREEKAAQKAARSAAWRVAQEEQLIAQGEIEMSVQPQQDEASTQGFGQQQSEQKEQDDKQQQAAGQQAAGPSASHVKRGGRNDVMMGQGNVMGEDEGEALVREMERSLFEGWMAGEEGGVMGVSESSDSSSESDSESESESEGDRIEREQRQQQQEESEGESEEESEEEEREGRGHFGLGFVSSASGHTYNRSGFSLGLGGSTAGPGFVSSKQSDQLESVVDDQSEPVGMAEQQHVYTRSGFALGLGSSSSSKSTTGLGLGSITEAEALTKAGLGSSSIKNRSSAQQPMDTEQPFVEPSIPSAAAPLTPSVSHLTAGGLPSKAAAVKASIKAAKAAKRAQQKGSDGLTQQVCVVSLVFVSSLWV